MKKKEFNKEKLGISFTIGIACFSLMLVMFMQFKVVKQTDITAIENMRESELRVELSNWNEKYKELNEKYADITKKIEEYKNERESDEKTSQLLEDELQQLNEILGKTDVEGEGIIITIKDNGGNEDSDGKTIKNIKEQDLLLVINELISAGAEAISINDKRIINISEVVVIGDSYIKVNGERILSPYIIKAIGNSTYLESAVSGKGGQADALKEAGHTVSVDTSKKVKILKYDGTISTKYIN